MDQLLRGRDERLTLSGSGHRPPLSVGTVVTGNSTLPLSCPGRPSLRSGAVRSGVRVRGGNPGAGPDRAQLVHGRHAVGREPGGRRRHPRARPTPVSRSCARVPNATGHPSVGCRPAARPRREPSSTTAASCSSACVPTSCTSTTRTRSTWRRCGLCARRAVPLVHTVHNLRHVCPAGSAFHDGPAVHGVPRSSWSRCPVPSTGA